MIVTILESMYGIPQGAYDITEVLLIELSIDTTEYYNHDILMLISWCVSVDRHITGNNLDAELDFCDTYVLGRIHGSVEKLIIGSYEEIEV